MKDGSLSRFWFLRPVICVAFLAGWLGAAGATESQAPAAAQASGEVPVTTASPEARSLFIDARDRLDRVREKEAAALLEQAVAKDPDFALGYLYLSRAQDSPAEGRKFLDKAVALADKVTAGEKLMILIAQAERNRDRAKASELSQQLIAAYPEDKWTRARFGSSLINRGQYADAVPQLTKAIEIDPAYPLPYNQLGYAYRFLESWDKAEAAFKKYIELLPGEPNAHHSYGEFLLKVGRFDEAIDAFTKTLALDPHFYRAYMDMGTCYVLKDQPETARQVYKKLYDSSGDDRDRRSSHFATAVSYVDEGKADLALAELAKAHAYAEKANDAEAQSVDYVIRGRILLNAGKIAEAEESFGKALSVVEASQLPDAFKQNRRREHLYFEGRLALARQDIPAAKAKVDLLRKQVDAAADQPGLRWVHELQGMIALAEKSYDTAIAELQQADLQDPNNLVSIATAQLGKGDREAARQTAAKAAGFNRVNSFMYAFARRKARQMAQELAVTRNGAPPTD